MIISMKIIVQTIILLWRMPTSELQGVQLQLSLWLVLLSKIVQCSRGEDVAEVLRSFYNS